MISTQGISLSSSTGPPVIMLRFAGGGGASPRGTRSGERARDLNEIKSRCGLDVTGVILTFLALLSCSSSPLPYNFCKSLYISVTFF